MTTYTLNSYDRKTGEFNMASPGLEKEEAIRLANQGNVNPITSPFLRFEAVEETPEPSVQTPGTRVRATMDLDVNYDLSIPAGTEGTVIRVQPSKAYEFINENFGPVTAKAMDLPPEVVVVEFDGLPLADHSTAEANSDFAFKARTLEVVA